MWVIRISRSLLSSPLRAWRRGAAVVHASHLAATLRRRVEPPWARIAALCRKAQVDTKMLGAEKEGCALLLSEARAGGNHPEFDTSSLASRDERALSLAKRASELADDGSPEALFKARLCASCSPRG